MKKREFLKGYKIYRKNPINFYIGKIFMLLLATIMTILISAITFKIVGISKYNKIIDYSIVLSVYIYVVYYLILIPNTYKKIECEKVSKIYERKYKKEG